MIKANIEVQGFADPGVGAVDDVLSDALNTGANVLTVAMSRAEGDDCHVVEVIDEKFAQSSSINGLVRCSGSFQANGDLNLGALLHEPTEETASGNGSAINSAGETTDGGVAHLHLTAHAGTGNVTVTIEDSANGTTGWATIGTFAAFGVVGSERLAIAGTVRQYTRAVWTKAAGVTSFTFTLALARL